MTLDEIKDAIGVKPYHEEKRGVIYCADCLDILPKIPDKAVDLCLTDPPYGINVVGGSKKFGSVGGSKKFGSVSGSNMIHANRYAAVINDDIKIDLSQLFRIGINQIIFGGNYFNMPTSKGWIVWDKKCKNDWDDNFSDGELAWTSFNKPLKIFRHLYMGLMKENTDEINRVHPTQKPVRLLEWILKNYSDIDHIIIDPFLGSGTTAVAAKQLGRQFIGIEISQKYCDIAVQRLQQEILL